MAIKTDPTGAEPIKRRREPGRKVGMPRLAALTGRPARGQRPGAAPSAAGTGARDNASQPAAPRGDRAEQVEDFAADADDGPIFRTSLRAYVNLGIATAVALVVGLGGWAAMANVSGAVVANGVVAVSSRVKDVQHRDGGIVADIFVDESDAVQAGDLLVRLDDTQSRAGYNLVEGQLSSLQGRMDRLVAERDKAPTVTFRPALMARIGEPAIAEMMLAQRGVFAARKATQDGQTDQLREQIAQLEQQIAGLDAQRSAKREEIVLVQDELADLNQLLRRNLVPRSRVTAREREAVRLDGEEGDLTARIATARGRIAELRMAILQIETEFQQAVLDEISEVQTEILTLSERNVAADDELARVELRAPVAGLVHELAVTTIGGVVAPGATLMRIVPQTDDLVIEARVSPLSIDELAPGQSADVVFSGLSARESPRLSGEVIALSAETTQDERTGETYFTARVHLPKSERAKLGDVAMVPGMPAQVFIQTRARSVLSYLMEPLLDAANIAFTES